MYKFNQAYGDFELPMPEDGKCRVYKPVCLGHKEPRDLRLRLHIPE